MRPIVLKGNLVSLAVPLRDDVRKAWLWFNDRNVRLFLTAPEEVFFFEDEMEWYERIRRAKAREKVFSIVENSTSSLVGFIGLHRINHRDGNAELGYFLGNEHWGKGCGSEAVSPRLRLQLAQPQEGLREGLRAERCLD